jgi:hypothetical protein
VDFFDRLLDLVVKAQEITSQDASGKPSPGKGTAELCLNRGKTT